MTSKIRPQVFFPASGIIAALVLVGVLFPRNAERIFGGVQAFVLDTFGWFYLLAVGILLFSVLFFALSRFGRLKLGPDDAEPDYPYVSWLAMLFAAGMGIGLMFYAVAEPVLHYSVPPEAEPRTIEAARQAMEFTFFHWGVHAWAVYAVVGLSLAYFSFRYNLPLTIRSGFYPLIRERIDGPIGHAVDVFAICGTVFGIATSLGLGVLQMNAGLNHLLGVPEAVWVQILLIAVVMGAATLSVVSGLDAGVRRLSEGNLILAILLMLFVLVVGPTTFLFKAFVQNIGTYLDDLLPRTFTLYAYEPRGWISDWTLFYWAWWISWSPFVGMFIARISRGRTVREFVLGVLFVPSAFTFFWMTVFGNSAIALDLGPAAGAIASEVQANLSVALFQFFEYLPLSGVTSTLAVALVGVFFVTSADSGSLVVDSLASGGADDTPVWQRIYWCILQGSVAALLLLAGGLVGLQTMTLIAALPFAVILLLLAFGLLRGMQADVARLTEHRQAQPAIAVRGANWQARLGAILHEPTRRDVTRFVETTAQPALTEVRDELVRRGLPAELTVGEDGQVALTVPAEGARDFLYGIEPTAQPAMVFSAADTRVSPAGRRMVWSARTLFSDGSRGYDVIGFTKADLLADVLAQFERYQLLMQAQSTQLYTASPAART
ncbi:BCCT family transporter [Aureimonas sp. AU22]|uniref:BCCT family transporter n=1 Tax=Aureimonas sp. AU22 TaxID=1638162 RepID=UPI0007820C82|nr:BCCT family transporter [Aureimonas sp. AU22]